MNKALLQKAKKELDNYPPRYDAHKDALADAWDIEDSTNRLLELLRLVVKDAEKKK